MSLAVYNLALFLLIVLLGYTIFLVARAYISAQSAVRWICAEIIALGVFATWRYLPFFEFTSGLTDRELMLVVVVVFFALICFLMLDAMVHISKINIQIKILTQELALLRLQVEDETDKT